MLKFYGYKQCGTCRKAEQFLQQAEIDYDFIDITENPPNAKELAAIAERANVSLNKLFNTSGVQYRELKIKEQLPALSGREILTMLAGNGRLIKGSGAYFMKLLLYITMRYSWFINKDICLG